MFVRKYVEMLLKLRKSRLICHVLQLKLLDLGLFDWWMLSQMHMLKASLVQFDITHVCVHSFIHPVIRSFTLSLIHSFILSLIHSLTHSLTHSFTHSLTHSLIHVFTRSLSAHLTAWELALHGSPTFICFDRRKYVSARSQTVEIVFVRGILVHLSPARSTHSILYTPFHSTPLYSFLTPLCSTPLNSTPIHSTPVTHSVTHSFTHSLTHSLTHSFAHSISHSFTHSDICALIHSPTH